jgi:hypothetical protein
MKKKNPTRREQNLLNKRKYQSKRGRQNKHHSRKKKKHRIERQLAPKKKTPNPKKKQHGKKKTIHLVKGQLGPKTKLNNYNPSCSTNVALTSTLFCK